MFIEGKSKIFIINKQNANILRKPLDTENQIFPIRGPYLRGLYLWKASVAPSQHFLHQTELQH